MATGELAKRFEKSEGWGTPIAFSPDSKLAVLGKYDPKEKKSHLVLVEAASGKEVRPLDVWGEAIGFTPDSRRLVVGSNEPDLGREVKFALLELATGRVLSSTQFGSIYSPTFAFSPDGRLVFTGTGIYPGGGAEHMKLRLWDLAKGDLVRTLDDSPWAVGR